MSLSWRVELSSHAARSLKKLDKPIQAAIVIGLAKVAEDLSAGKPISAVAANVTKLVGSDPAEWRLRVGEYRARFQVEVRRFERPDGGEDPPQEEGVIVVTRVAHRRDVYRDS